MKYGLWHRPDSSIIPYHYTDLTYRKKEAYIYYAHIVINIIWMVIILAIKWRGDGLLSYSPDVKAYYNGSMISSIK